MSMAQLRNTLFGFLDNVLPSGEEYQLLRGALARGILGYKTAVGLRLAKGVDLSGFHAITIGPNCYLGDGCILKAYSPISIGANVRIGSQTIIWTGTHVVGDENHRAGDACSQPIAIGSGTWIGLRCVIHKDVGNGCIVDSSSTVVAPVADNTHVAGNPARPVRKLPVSTKSDDE